MDWSTKVNYAEKNPVIVGGTEHTHALIHVVDAPKIDEIEDNELVEFIDKHITCFTVETKYPKISNLVKKVQIHHNRTTCRKKKCVAYRFNAIWVPSGETKIIRSEEKMDETKVKKSKKLEKVLSYIVKRSV